MFCMLSIVLEHEVENNKQNYNNNNLLNRPGLVITCTLLIANMASKVIGSTIFRQVHDVSRRQFLINSRGNFQSLASGLSTLEVYFGVDRCENRGRSTTMVPCDKGSSVFV